MSQQPVDQLGDQIAIRLVVDQRIQDNAIGAPVRVEHEILLVTVGGGKVGRARCLHRPVVDQLADGGYLGGRGGVIAQHLPEPGNALQRLIFQFGPVEDAARLGRVHIAHQLAHIKRIAAQCALGKVAVPGLVMAFNVAQIFQHAALCIRRHRKALLLGALQGVGHVNGVIGHRFLAPFPNREATIVVLQASQPG